MANLTDDFSDAAVQDPPQDGPESVATAFNAQSTTVKEPMTTQEAIDSPVLETARIITPREELSDEAFAAVARGDVLKLKSLLKPDSGLDPAAKDPEGVSLLDRAVERFTLFQNAVEQNETERQQDELVRKVDPEERADAGLAALMLASANGNVEVAQMVLDEMVDDELDDDDDDVAEEIALEHGNMSVYYAVMARKQRKDFNKSADDPHAEERDPAPVRVESDGTFEWFLKETHRIGEVIHEDVRKLANAFHRAAHATSVATHDIYEAALRFASTFLHLGAGQGPGGTDTTMSSFTNEIQKQIAQDMGQTQAPGIAPKAPTLTPPAPAPDNSKKL
jgi:hypothetical protein